MSVNYVVDDYVANGYVAIRSSTPTDMLIAIALTLIAADKAFDDRISAASPTFRDIPQNGTTVIYNDKGLIK